MLTVGVAHTEPGAHSERDRPHPPLEQEEGEDRTDGQTSANLMSKVKKCVISPCWQNVTKTWFFSHLDRGVN